MLVAVKPQLVATAMRQGGLVTRAQARDAGCRGPELRSLTAVGGEWVVVRRGVYVERLVWQGLDELERWKLRDRAAHLTCRLPHELTHDSACRLHDLPLVAMKRDLSHLSRPDVQGSRTEHGVKHHRGPVPSPDAQRVDGIPVTGTARSALDVAREHGLMTGMAACDAAMRQGVSRTQLDDELATMAHWPGVVSARDSAALADPRAENAGESLARHLVLELGIGDPQPQFAVRLDGRIVWCDLRVGNHVFEFDGRIKYRPLSEGGVATKSAEEVVWAEKARERLVCAEGLGVSRIIWSDFFGAARDRARRRLLAEYAGTVTRYGTRLPDPLAEFARLHSYDRVPRPRIAS
jgi:hypothetical protein